MRFSEADKKQTNMNRMAGKFLRQASQGKGMVSTNCLTSFCGSAVSLTLSVSLARFYTRSLYDCLSHAKREIDWKRARVRLMRVARRDLKFWQKLGPEALYMREPDAELCAHSDATDLVWGGTLIRDMLSRARGRERRGAARNLVVEKDIDDDCLARAALLLLSAEKERIEESTEASWTRASDAPRGNFS